MDGRTTSDTEALSVFYVEDISSCEPRRKVLFDELPTNQLYDIKLVSSDADSFVNKLPLQRACSRGLIYTHLAGICTMPFGKIDMYVTPHQRVIHPQTEGAD